MAATELRTGTDGDADDIIRMLDQPVSARLCPETSTIKGRRVPTCALIMLCVVGAVGLLAYSLWPGRTDGAQRWNTRTIALPNGAGTAYHHDRVIDSFFGTFERRIDIDGAHKSGTVWLPASEQAYGTRADFIWRESRLPGRAMGPWLEISEGAANYLIDMREIGLYRIHQVNGHLCAVALGTAAEETAGRPVDQACASVRSVHGHAFDISHWARNWSTHHLGMLDRRRNFVPGESVHSSIRGGNPIRGKPLASRGSTAAGPRPCTPPVGHPVLRGPPRLEFIGVVSGPPRPPCHGRPIRPGQ